MKNWIIDWNAVKTVIEALESIAVLVASIFATLGLNQWRKEIVGKRIIELAEEATYLFSELPDIYRYVRDRFITIEASDNSPLASCKARWSRFQLFNDHYLKIAGLKYRFVCYFGEEGKKPFQTFERLHKKFVDDLSLRTDIARHKENNTTATQETDWEKTILFQGNNDSFQQELEQARDEVLAICGKYLKIQKIPCLASFFSLFARKSRSDFH